MAAAAIGRRTRSSGCCGTCVWFRLGGAVQGRDRLEGELGEGWRGASASSRPVQWDDGGGRDGAPAGRARACRGGSGLPRLYAAAGPGGLLPLQQGCPLTRRSPVRPAPLSSPARLEPQPAGRGFPGRALGVSLVFSVAGQGGLRGLELEGEVGRAGAMPGPVVTTVPQSCGGKCPLPLPRGACSRSDFMRPGSERWSWQHGSGLRCEGYLR